MASKITIKRVTFFKGGGMGKLPEDMLRYDIAFINDRFPDVVAYPLFHTRDRGSWGGRVTEGRWSSFCWHLKPVEKKDLPDLEESILTDPDQWFTARDSSYRSETLDYGSLGKMSLATYLEDR